MLGKCTKKKKREAKGRDKGEKRKFGPGKRPSRRSRDIGGKARRKRKNSKSERDNSNWGTHAQREGTTGRLRVLATGEKYMRWKKKGRYP